MAWAPGSVYVSRDGRVTFDESGRRLDALGHKTDTTTNTKDLIPIAALYPQGEKKKEKAEPPVQAGGPTPSVGPRFPSGTGVQAPTTAPAPAQPRAPLGSAGTTGNAPINSVNVPRPTVPYKPMQLWDQNSWRNVDQQRNAARRAALSTSQTPAASAFNQPQYNQRITTPAVPEPIPAYQPRVWRQGAGNPYQAPPGAMLLRQQQPTAWYPDDIARQQQAGVALPSLPIPNNLMYDPYRP